MFPTSFVFLFASIVLHPPYACLILVIILVFALVRVRVLFVWFSWARPFPCAFPCWKCPRAHSWAWLCAYYCVYSCASPCAHTCASSWDSPLRLRLSLCFLVLVLVRALICMGVYLGLPVCLTLLTPVLLRVVVIVLSRFDQARSERRARAGASVLVEGVFRLCPMHGQTRRPVLPPHGSSAHCCCGGRGRLPHRLRQQVCAISRLLTATSCVSRLLL